MKRWFSRAVALGLLVSGQYAFAAQQVSGINRLTFFDEQHSKAFLGNGFLIRHNDKVLAVTVKHALLEAKTPDMQSVAIKEHIAQWQIHPNQQPDQAVLLGKLLNRAEHEAIDMQVLQKDWLVFEVADNRSNLSVLTLRDTPLEVGETLTAVGCSYANAATCKQDRYQGEFIALEPANLRMTMPDAPPASLRGLSGSPVLDAQGQVVGIVSNIMPSQSGEGLDFAPANLKYLMQVLTHL